MDKSDPPVFLIFQFIQDITVENKDGNNGLIVFQGMVQCSVVKEAAISPEPENIYGGFH
jgi:hypothetical protein